MKLNLFSMFHEKDETGKSTGDWSMTRVVVFLFAANFNAALFKFGFEHISWPVACVMIVVMMALPLIWLFDSLASWFGTPPGKALLSKALDLVPGKITSSLNVTTEKETGA